MLKIIEERRHWKFYDLFIEIKIRRVSISKYQRYLSDKRWIISKDGSQIVSNSLTPSNRVVEKEAECLLCSEVKAEHVYFDVRKFH